MQPPSKRQPPADAGVRTADGRYLSRQTAEYPPELAQQFAQIIFPLLSDQNQELTLDNFERWLSIKDINAPPFSRQDGAGLKSQGDWSGAHQFEDSFQVLRKKFLPYNHGPAFGPSDLACISAASECSSFQI